MILFLLIPDLMVLVIIVYDHPDVWLHIDAAWAGAAFACPEYRERCHLPATNKYADSLCINFHKVWIRSFSFSPFTIEGTTVGIG